MHSQASAMAGVALALGTALAVGAAFVQAKGHQRLGEGFLVAARLLGLAAMLGSLGGPADGRSATKLATAGLILAVAAPRFCGGSRTELACRVWGTGRPVVFLHGAGASSRYWRALRRHSSGYRGIAPDLLGFGCSPKPRRSAYDVEAHVAALEPLIPAGSVVVGHSIGAVLAVALAARRPGRVAGLLLLGTPAFPDPETARLELGRLGILARLTFDRPWLGWALCQVMCLFRPLVTAVVSLLVTDVPASIASDATRHTWRSYRRTIIRLVVDHRVAAELAAVTAPTVLLHGRQDQTAPLSHLAGVVSPVATQALEVVDGDHQLAVHQPELVAAHLARLLGSVVPPLEGSASDTRRFK